MTASTPPALFGQTVLGTGYRGDTHSEMHGRTLELHENLLAYGGVGDGVELTDAATTNTSTTVTCPSANWTSEDIGKSITIAGAGAAGAALNGTIVSRTSATSIVISAAAGATTSGKGCNYGTDNSAAFVAMLAATTATLGNHYFIPPGKYKFATTIPFNTMQYRVFRGAGEARTLLMAPGNDALFTHSSGLNQQLVFQDMRITGPEETLTYPLVTTPRSTGFLLTSTGGSGGIAFERVVFNNLAYSINDDGVAHLFVGWRFTDVGFLNAPFSLTGPEAHNANYWYKCRWVGTRQEKPAIKIANTGFSASNNSFRDCDWESNHHEAAVLWNQASLCIDNAYGEFNNDLGVAGKPWFNLGASLLGLTVNGGWFVSTNNNTAVEDIIFGSTNASPQSNHVVINNAYYSSHHAAVIDRANMPDLVEHWQGSSSFGTQTEPVSATPTYNFNALKIDGGTSIKKFTTATVTVDPASIAANTTGETDVTVTGAAIGDVVYFLPPDTLNAGIVVSAPSRVSADNTVKLRLGNTTTAPIDVASSSWIYVWWDIT